jgi:nicotinamide phosphoribosyltransferase
MYEYTIFFGLQYILKEWLEGEVVTREKIDKAEAMMSKHFEFAGVPWSRAKWDYIVDNCGGKLPIEIKAVPEGLKMPVSNVLFTIENTDPNCAWLTNALETLLQHVWYGTTVATRAHYIMTIIKKYFKETVDESNQWLAEYYLHSFGQRACAGMEQAGIGGSAELISIMGTDTVMGIDYAMRYYGMELKDLPKSVVASEHAVQCSLGKEGEFEVTKNLIKKFPDGILSVVSDTYDIENAVRVYCTDLKEEILGRNGKFVVRPDSSRFKGDTPEDQVLWIVNELAKSFGTTVNSFGYRVLHPSVGCIYGDSLTEVDIENILRKLKENGFSAESCVFGCGSYLLDKLNRDTMRFAIKGSAICVDGVWKDIYKEPSDKSKASKRGKLKLVKKDEGFITVREDADGEDLLETVFLNGKILREMKFKEIKENSNI